MSGRVFLFLPPRGHEHHIIIIILKLFRDELIEPSFLEKFREVMTGQHRCSNVMIGQYRFYNFGLGFNPVRNEGFTAY